MRKEEIFTSNFSFSHNVFYSYMSSVRQSAVLCGNAFRLGIQSIHHTASQLLLLKLGTRYYSFQTDPLQLSQYFPKPNQSKSNQKRTNVSYVTFSLGVQTCLCSKNSCFTTDSLNYPPDYQSHSSCQ